MDTYGHVSTVTTSSVSQYWARFVCRDGTQATGMVPGPAYSVSQDRIYWWDGRAIHWLSRDGSRGSESENPGSQVGLEFAASPDDSRMVITAIDFSRWPLHRATWVEDVGTHRNRVTLFDGNLPTDWNALDGEGSAGWPWGWHDGRPVLYDRALCATLGGDQFFALSYPRVVDPATGSRLLNFPKCYGGSITATGVLCTESFTARSLDWYDWTGKHVQSFSLPFDTVACNGDSNPSGNRVLAYCQNNIYTDTAANDSSKQFLFGAGPGLPSGIAKYSRVQWLTDDLVLEGAFLNNTADPRTSVTVWSLSKQSRILGPIVIPGWYGGDSLYPPVTRLIT